MKFRGDKSGIYGRENTSRRKRNFQETLFHNYANFLDTKYFLGYYWFIGKYPLLVRTERLSGKPLPSASGRAAPYAQALTAVWAVLLYGGYTPPKEL